VLAGLDTDVIQLKSFEISPDPPQPGKDLTITVKGHAAERIGVCTWFWSSEANMGRVVGRSIRGRDRQAQSDQAYPEAVRRVR
jgi:hypothetical protein